MSSVTPKNIETPVKRPVGRPKKYLNSGDRQAVLREKNAKWRGDNIALGRFACKECRQLFGLKQLLENHLLTRLHARRAELAKQPLFN